MSPMLKSAAALAATGVLGWSVPAAAQSAPATVSAENPEGVAAALRFAGYPAKLGKDSAGDPKIDTEFGSYKGSIYFYGCDEKTHKGCDSLQFHVGFDREKPMALKSVNDLVTKYRFASIQLDNEGDPLVQWDIITDDGIPSGVFLHAFRRFGEVADTLAETIFEDQ